MTKKVADLLVPFVGDTFRDSDRCQASGFCADNSARDLEIGRVFQNVLGNLSCFARTSISGDENNLKYRLFAYQVIYEICFYKLMIKLNLSF